MKDTTRNAPNLRGIWTDRAQPAPRPTGGFLNSIVRALKPAARSRMTHAKGTYTLTEKSNG